MRSRKADNSGMSDVETRNVTLDNDDDDDGCYACALVELSYYVDTLALCRVRAVGRLENVFIG